MAVYAAAQLPLIALLLVGGLPSCYTLLVGPGIAASAKGARGLGGKGAWQVKVNCVSTMLSTSWEAGDPCWGD
jgi:hypothetical protein